MPHKPPTRLLLRHARIEHRRQVNGTYSDLALLFVYVQASAWLDDGLEIAAQQTLNKIQRFQALPPSEQPPLMSRPEWPVVHSEIRRMTSVSNRP